MVFDTKPHLMNLKGKQYLPVAPRIAWLREEHPDAIFESELVMLDLEKSLAVFRATVTLPQTGAKATDYGSETERDFPAGWIEKAHTKALGRAIAALGFGTLMAVEFEEGERVVDSPVTPSRTARSARDVAALRGEVAEALSTDAEAASKLPKGPDEMTADELDKTLTWLRNRAKRRR